MSYPSRFAILALALGTANAAIAAPARPPGAPAAPGARPSAPGPTGPAAPLPPVQRTLVNPNSVLVFPFDRAPKPNAPPTLGETIAGQIRSGMDASGRYTAATFYRHSPLVLRNVTQGYTGEDLNLVIDPQRGVVDPDRAMRIASGVGVASVVLGSIEEYGYDPNTRRADITVTVQFLQVPGGTPIKTVGITGTATGAVGASEESVAQMAARDAARRALTEMGVPPRPTMMAPTPAARTGAAKRTKTERREKRGMVD